jgi:transposase-like protein
MSIWEQPPRRFTLEYRIEAAHRVIDSNRSLSEVAKELSLVPDTLGRWVKRGEASYERQR